MRKLFTFLFLTSFFCFFSCGDLQKPDLALSVKTPETLEITNGFSNTVSYHLLAIAEAAAPARTNVGWSLKGISQELHELGYSTATIEDKLSGFPRQNDSLAIKNFLNSYDIFSADFIPDIKGNQAYTLTLNHSPPETEVSVLCVIIACNKDAEHAVAYRSFKIIHTKSALIEVPLPQLESNESR